MNKIVTVRMSLMLLAGVLALAPLMAAQSSEQTSANGVNVTGRVSCSRLGRGSVTARKGMSVTQTINYCAIFQGGKYTLVSGNRIYLLTGDPKQLEKMAGKTVTVAGHMVPESTDTTSVQLMGTLAVIDVVPTKE
jgi:hypothetical protein